MISRTVNLRSVVATSPTPSSSAMASPARRPSVTLAVTTIRVVADVPRTPSPHGDKVQRAKLREMARQEVWG